MLIGNKVHILPTCHSTNDYIKSKIPLGLSSGEVFCAENQTGGKGQRGNVWESEANKNLTFSFFLNEIDLPVTEQFVINYFVSIAIHRFLSKFLSRPESLKLKWPNDIYCGEKKLGGVLIENQVKNGKLSHTIIGIGLNINQEVFKVERATSLFLETGECYDVKEALGFLLKELNVAFEEFNTHKKEVYKFLYLSKLMRMNEVAKYHDNVRDCVVYGKIIDVKNTGVLVLKTDDKILEYSLKEISFLFS